MNLWNDFTTSDTWLGGIYRALAGSPTAVAVGVVVLLMVGFVIFSGLFIAKGGGQYGIIEGYVGTIGAGKTTLAVQHALGLAKARNAVLLSNVPVICGKRCEQASVQVLAGVTDRWCVIDHRTLPMTDDGLDLATLTRVAFDLRDQQRGLVLLMDEVGVIMPARLWKDFSVALMWVLQQSRKLACEWIWTAQDPSFVDHQLRSLTSVVHYVRSYPPPSIWRRVKGKRPWVLIASAYTPMAAPRANGDGQRTERRLGRSIKRYKRSWEGAFNTDAVVLPSKHLKGSEAIRGAAQGDRNAVDMGGVFGPTVEAAPEPPEGSLLERAGLADV